MHGILVLQSAMDLLQIATSITKCDDYYKLRQYSVRIIEVGNVWFLVFLGPHELSVIERCP